MEELRRHWSDAEPVIAADPLEAYVARLRCRILERNDNAAVKYQIVDSEDNDRPLVRYSIVNPSDPAKASLCMYCHQHGCTKSVKLSKSPGDDALHRFAAAGLAMGRANEPRSQQIKQQHLQHWPPPDRG